MKVKLTESKLKQIVAESVNEVLKESSIKIEGLELVNSLKELRAAVRKNIPIIDKNCDLGNEGDRLGMICSCALNLMQEIDEYLKY
jgi:hypothetical protein